MIQILNSNRQAHFGRGALASVLQYGSLCCGWRPKVRVVTNRVGTKSEQPTATPRRAPLQRTRVNATIAEARGHQGWILTQFS